jgi:hypothetical protein
MHRPSRPTLALLAFAQLSASPSLPQAGPGVGSPPRTTSLGAALRAFCLSSLLGFGGRQVAASILSVLAGRKRLPDLRKSRSPRFKEKPVASAIPLVAA